MNTRNHRCAIFFSMFIGILLLPVSSYADKPLVVHEVKHESLRLCEI